MAKIIFGDKEVELVDGENITDVCEELGVPFSCKEGVCGVCRVEVVDGADNLSELTDNESDFGMDKNTRLACQCKIKSGNVKLNF